MDEILRSLLVSVPAAVAVIVTVSMFLKRQSEESLEFRKVLKDITDGNRNDRQEHLQALRELCDEVRAQRESCTGSRRAGA